MNQDKKRSKLALAEGFIPKSSRFDWMGETGRVINWTLYNAKHEPIEHGRPEYFTNLQAVQRARRKLLVTEDQQTAFISVLGETIVPPTKGHDECIYELLDADARLQADALGIVLGLWERPAKKETQSV